MENLIENRNGWWWPKYDIVCWKFLSTRPDVPKLVSEFVKEKNVIIQAGGNSGMYVKFYQEIFNTVYTFEPDPINFYCLTKNTGNNVIKFQSCLGNEKKLVNLTYYEDKKPNSGGLFVKDNGTYPILRIDDLSLPECNLIHLDIEGYEGFALQGAKETINRCRPIIALEMCDNGKQYGWPDSKIVELLNNWKYVEIGKVKEDVVFEYKN